MLMRSLFLIFFLALPLNNFAKGYNNRFATLLNDINTLSTEDYTDSILRMKKKMDTLFDKKKSVCIGEFSEDIFFEKAVTEDTPAEVKDKQSKTECFLELKEHLNLYYKALHQQRKKFFVYSHKMQLKKLELDYTKLSKSLQVEIDALKKKLKRSGTR